MGTATSNPMALDADDLNDVDEWIVDFLNEHEWATIQLMREFYLDEEGDISRQWLAQRTLRLLEHEHLRKVKDTPTYQLVDDPRD